MTLRSFARSERDEPLVGRTRIDTKTRVALRLGHISSEPGGAPD